MDGRTESVAEACFVLPATADADAGAGTAFPPLFFGHEPPALAAERRRRYDADAGAVHAAVHRHMEGLVDATVDRIMRFVDGTGEFRHLAVQPQRAPATAPVPTPTPAPTAGGEQRRRRAPASSPVSAPGPAAPASAPGPAPAPAPRPAPAPAPSAPGRAYHEVPTGVICAGVNVPDHGDFFARLAARLRTNPRHHLAVITSAEAGSSLKSLVQCLVDQLTKAPLPYDFGALRAWYRTLPAERQGRIVILLEDFHAFDPSALADFVTVCSDSDSALLPVMLLLGVSTSPQIVHEMLPGPVLTRISTERFELPSAGTSLDQIVLQLFSERVSGFRLGNKSFRYLVDTYLSQHVSIQQFLRTLQYALMDHYFANPLSVLTEPFGRRQSAAARAAILEQLTPLHAQALRLLPSLQRYCEEHAESDPAVVKRLLCDDAYLLQRALPQFLDHLDDIGHRGTAVRAVLRLVQRRFTTPSLRRPEHVLYQASLDGPLQDHLDIKTLLRALSFLPRADLADLLDAAARTLAAVPSPALVGTRARLDTLRAELQELPMVSAAAEARHTELDNVLLATVIARQEAAIEREQQQVLSKRRRTTLLEGGDVAADDVSRMTDRPRRAYKELCQAVRGWIEEAIRDHVPAYQTLPLHEVVYSNRSLLLKRARSAQPRLALLTALANPWQYLPKPSAAKAAGLPERAATEGTSKRAVAKRKAASVANVAADASLALDAGPDVCVLYRLYQECPRLINLHDLFLAFAAAVDADDASDDVTLRARFMRSVAELQWMGLAKSTRRKTDHLVRLAWN